MCGGFAIVYNNISIFSEQFGVDENDVGGLEPAFNIRPTDEHTVVVGSEHAAISMRWGLVPRWSKEPNMAFKTINARLETVAEKASYKEPLKTQRCLVPASGYYEWVAMPDGKQPYFLHPKTRPYWAFAGLYDSWRDASGASLQTFTIITQDAVDAAGHVHARMPAIVPHDSYEAWLDPAVRDPEEAKAILRPPDDELEIFPVSRRVNKSDNQGADLIEAIGEKVTTRIRPEG